MNFLPSCFLLWRTVAAILFSALTAAPTLAAGGAETVVVRVDDDKLVTVRAKDQPFAKVFAAVAKATGTRVDGLEHIKDERITVDLGPLPLDAVLKQLIGERSHGWATMNAPAPGASPYEIQFPPPPKATGATRDPASMPRTGRAIVIEETIVIEDGKPRYVAREVPQPPPSARPSATPPALPDPTDRRARVVEEEWRDQSGKPTFRVRDVPQPASGSSNGAK